MNAIKRATQLMIQSTFWALNNNFKYKDPKNTHTHTTSLTNLYISKTSQDSLVSIY